VRGIGAGDTNIMYQFDISQYVDFRPPGYLCPRCASIWRADEQIDWPEGWEYFSDETLEAWKCGVCQLWFETSRCCPDLKDYLKTWHCFLEFHDLANHLRSLGSAAAELRSPAGQFTRPGRALRNMLAALNQARHFVHVITWGLSLEFIGMLALLSHRVSVRAVVSGCEEKRAQELLEAQAYGGEDFEVIPLRKGDSASRPHQKLIVIDGIMAISGSANFTIPSWWGVDNGHEHVLIETRPERVWELNNTLFSPVWQTWHPVTNDVVSMRRHGRCWADSLKRIEDVHF